MKIEGYVIEIIKKIEEEGYQAYLVGAAVLKHILGRPIEEYDIITSAPFFSFSKNYKEYEGKIHIFDYSKPVHISFSLSKEDYYKGCCYRIDTILYHHKHGILDEYYGLDDIEKKKLTVLNWKNLEDNPIFLLDALDYKVTLDFSFDNKLKNYISFYQGSFPKALNQRIRKYFPRFFLSEHPGKFFLEYKHLFSFFFPIQSFRMKVLDYTKNDLILRLAAIWNDEDFIQCESFLDEYAFPKKIKMDVLSLLEAKKHVINEYHLEELIYEVPRKSIELLFSLKRAECLAEKQISQISILDDLEKKISSLRKNPIFSLRDLDISIEDLEKLGYTESQMSMILKSLFQLVKENQIENQREELRNVAATFLQKNGFF